MIIINVETVVVLHILLETVIHFFKKKKKKKNLTINFSGGVYFLYLFSGLLRGP